MNHPGVLFEAFLEGSCFFSMVFAVCAFFLGEFFFRANSASFLQCSKRSFSAFDDFSCVPCVSFFIVFRDGSRRRQCTDLFFSLTPFRMEFPCVMLPFFFFRLPYSSSSRQTPLSFFLHPAFKECLLLLRRVGVGGYTPF